MQGERSTRKAAGIILLLLFPAAAALSFLYYTIYNNSNSGLGYGILFGVLVLLSAAMSVCCAKTRNAGNGEAIVSGVISAAVSACLLHFAAYLLGSALGKPTEISGLAAMNLYAIQLLITVLFGRVKTFKAAISIAISGALFLSSGIFMAALPLYYSNHYSLVEAPVGTAAAPQRKTEIIENADFYVSPDGNDDNPGTFKSPFATVERARDAVRQLDKNGRAVITVAFKSGVYRTKGIEFTKEDSGTADCPVTYCAYGNGEAVIDGGVTLNPSDFSPVGGDVRNRLSIDAVDSVVQIDLKKYGLTAEDWGKIYATGTHNTGGMYDGGSGPVYCELFVNDNRMTMARYPNGNKFLHIEEVSDIGDVAQYPPETLNPDFYLMRNPQGGTFTMDEATSRRAASWKTTADVWLLGYFYDDCSDSTTPIEKITGNALTIKFTSMYGIKKDARYCFFNVLEELDAPGEYYLDRATGILYLYTPSDVSQSAFGISIATDALINVNGADYLTFKGLTVRQGRSDGILINGSNNTVSECVIKNVSEGAVRVSGSANRIEKNEIYHTGKGGIYLTGGDIPALTHAENSAENNLIHDWGEIYLTGAPGIELTGCGSCASHNEMYNSPHCAVWYDGNDHVIEYNLIHDVAKGTSDTGAIYAAGKSWTTQGCRVNCNCIYNIGSADFTPNGIYLDAASSGQTAHGNILVNIPGSGFLIGGGRDNHVYNNIIINSGKSAVNYDDRAREGFVGDCGFKGNVKTKDGSMWVNLYAMPYKSELWASRYPSLAKISDDFSDHDRIDFACNPSYSVIENNIILDEAKSIGEISESVYTFSRVSVNAVYGLTQDPGFRDKDSGDYTLTDNAKVYKSVPEFENIPIDKIGRIE